MAADQLVSVLKQELGTILTHSETDLLSRPDWGEINFESARPDIQAALSIAKDLSVLPLEELTGIAAQEIHGSISPVAQTLEEINEFSIASSGSPPQNRDELCDRLHNAVEGLRAHATPSIPYLAYKRGDIAESIEKLEGTIKNAQEIYNLGATWIDEKKGEIEKIESAARAAAASAGVGTFTSEFDTEAGRLQRRSNVG